MTADRLARSPVHLLHRAGQCAEAVFGNAVDSGLTPRQLAVLTAVGHNEGANQTGLVEATGIDRSTLSEMVKRLVKTGLLQRRRTKEDTRAYAVKLTDQGRRLLRSVDPHAMAVDERVLGALPGKSRERFVDALSRIVSALQRTEGAQSPRRRFRG
jgi:MarR family transcriptional regulator, temperature-dependent positive regulator of motility